VEAADLAGKAPLRQGVAKRASPLVVFGDNHEILIRKLAAQGGGARVNQGIVLGDVPAADSQRSSHTQRLTQNRCRWPCLPSPRWPGHA